MADCGCTPGIELTNPGGAKTFITYCPKHAAVDDLIAALKRANEDCCLACAKRWALQAQDAIRKSEIPAGAEG